MESKVHKVLVKIEKSLWAKFKAACALKNVTMAVRLTELIIKDLESSNN